MASVATDTIGGFNRFVSDQKKVPGMATLSLYQFDTVYERVIGPVSIQDVPDLTKDTFVPRGMTALLDAMGRAINDAGQRFSEMPEADRPSKVVMVVITDGLENSSKEFNEIGVNELITRQRDKYKWEFVFLGANQDAISTAASYGIGAANSMTYAANAGGVKGMTASLGRNMSNFRTGKVESMAFTDQDRKEQEDAGANQP